MEKEKKRLMIIMVIGFLSALVMFFFTYTDNDFIENIEHKMTDLKFEVRGVNIEGLDASDIVVVAVDDDSFRLIPYKWPWPRTYHATLVRNLRRAGASTIVFDIQFTEESTVDPEQDDEFARAITEGDDVVLAGKMITEEREKFSRRNVLAPIPKLREVAPFGLADTYLDSDGFVRRYNLFSDYEGERYLSLGVAALVKYLGLEGDPKSLITETDTGDYMLGGQYLLKRYDFDFPSTFINYFGPPDSFDTISFEQVVDEEGLQLLMEHDRLKDKIVLIGASVDELKDIFPTPFFVASGKNMPGVEIHANFVQMVLNQDFYGKVDDIVAYILTFVFTLAIAFLIKQTKPLIGILSAVGIAGAYFVANILLFTRMSTIMNFITPVGAIGLAIIGCYAFQYFSEEKEKLYIRSVFKHYLAENVVDTILQDADALAFGGQRRRLTVLFSDIRSFTTYSEKYTPEEVVSNLGEYLTDMVDVILRYGGMLDKFVGDEVMAVFGAPAHVPDHAEKACMTALEMIRSLDRLKDRWTGQGKEIFDIGIGVNTGDMLVGNLGSRQIFDYTVIGDNVNLGARLEGINKVYKTANNIIISEFTKNELSDKLVTRELDLVRVKGKARPVAIFELVGEKDIIVYSDEFLENYAQGLAAFKKQEWDRAVAEFKKALVLNEDDVSSMYIKRCRHNKKNPPGPDWDGVFTLTKK